jgi:hypothetical protein
MIGLGSAGTPRPTFTMGLSIALRRSAKNITQTNIPIRIFDFTMSSEGATFAPDDRHDPTPTVPLPPP